MRNLIRRLFGRFYTVRYSEAIIYKGSWRKGLFHGYGVLNYQNGSWYVGSFCNGLRHGFGTYTSSSGYIYEGDWLNGKQTGECHIFYKNGDSYKGAFLDGLKHGEGQLFEKVTDRIFGGNWKHGKLSGDVTVSCDAWQFKGKFPDSDGKTTGELVYKDGSNYKGQLVNFKRRGLGLYVSKLGDKIEGNWLNELNVKRAIKMDSEGIYWKGNLKNLEPEGFMNVKLPNGHEYDGLWEDGSLLRVLSVQNQTKQTSAYHFH